MTSAEQSTEATKWTILGERVIDDSRRGKFSVVSVELPDGVKFEQYVLRVRKGAIVAVVCSTAFSVPMPASLRVPMVGV